MWRHVMKWRAEYWTFDNRRLKCLKDVFTPEVSVVVKFYEWVTEIEEFRMKFSTDNEGESVRVRGEKKSKSTSGSGSAQASSAGSSIRGSP